MENKNNSTDKSGLPKWLVGPKSIDLETPDPALVRELLNIPPQAYRKRLFTDQFGDEVDKLPQDKVAKLENPESPRNPSSGKDNDFSESRVFTHPIQKSFQRLSKLTYALPTLQINRGEPVILVEGKFDLEDDYARVIQQANKYLAEVKVAIVQFETGNAEEIDLLDCEAQIETNLKEVSKIANQLTAFLNKKFSRHTNAPFSLRVLESITTAQASLVELWESVKKVMKRLQYASLVRDRKEKMLSKD